MIQSVKVTNFLLAEFCCVSNDPAMKKILLIAMVAAIAAGLFMYRHLTQNEITVRISQKEIDAILAKQFPREKTHWKIVQITYTNPRATFVPATNQVRIGIDAKIVAGIKPLEQEFHASTSLLTNLKYDADQKKVVLHNAQCEQLELPLIPEKYRDLTKQAMNITAAACFEKIPIYELKPRNQSQRIARMVLRDLHVDQDQLVFTLKLPDNFNE
jgi:hypothetical protein